MRKYLVLLGDGMADLPHEAFGGRTVLQAARTPNMDALAARGELGLVRTVPPGFAPGSDVANLSLFGYPPEKYYTGRAPLEAANIGVDLGPGQVAFRANLVTLVREEAGYRMEDYSAGHIQTEDARPLIEALDRAFADDGVALYTGTGYRHLMVLRDADPSLKTTPPHDISGKMIAPHLPQGPGQERLRGLMERSREILAAHPASKNLKTPATQVWLWGQGRAPDMPSFFQRFALRGAVVSAVDLVKGIGRCLDMRVLEIAGATGYLDTDYKAKVDAALSFLMEGGDFVFLHVEAPDECGHNGNAADKKRAIEDFDSRVVGPALELLEKAGGAYRILVLPDHATPLSLRRHTSDPVPFIMVSNESAGGEEGRGYNEESAAATGLLVPGGPELFARFLQGKE